MNLYDYILSEFEYDREVASMFCSVFEYREEPKDKLLIKQGNHSHNVIFFENGLARTCYRKGSKDYNALLLWRGDVLPLYGGSISGTRQYIRYPDTRKVLYASNAIRQATAVSRP